MEIDTHDNSVNIKSAHSDTAYTRIRIESEQSIGGYGLSATSHPYPMFIVEWTLLARPPGHLKDVIFREFLTLPEKNTLAWLDDLVRYKEEDGYVLTGISKVEDIILGEYEIPEDYRKFTCGEGLKPSWYTF